MRVSSHFNEAGCLKLAREKLEMMTTPRRRAWTIALVLLVARVPAAASQNRAREDSLDELRHEAINILQGVDTAPFLDTARVVAVATALRAIGSQIPRLAAVRNRHDRTLLQLSPADSVKHLFDRRRSACRRSDSDTDDWSTTPTRTGLRAIDSLNRVFGVARTLVECFGDRAILTLDFRRPVDVRVVARSYARVPQLEYAHPPYMLGDGHWIAVIPKGPNLYFVFALGGGDCPAGCTRWDYYYVTYHVPDSTVVLEHTILHGAPWTEPIAYWDLPSRNSITPYPTIESVFAGMRDARWWYRQHAIEVLHTLLGPDERVRYGEQSQQLFTALKRAALSRRREAYGALIDRLEDPDPDIARLAHRDLIELSGEKLPGGSEGVARWRQWLDRSP